MQVFIYCKITLQVSGVHRTYHQAAVTVLCTPDDGCDGHPKHVE